MFIPLRGLGSLGVVPDSQGQALPIGAWHDARNVRFSGLSFEKMLEPELEALWQHGDPYGTPVHMQGWSDGTSSYMAVATSGGYIFYWRASTADDGRWIQAGGPYPEGNWQSFEWGDTVIFNNGAVPPQIFNPDSLKFEDLDQWGMISTATDISGDESGSLAPSRDTSARCKVILPYKSTLVAIGVTEFGLYRANTVWWSNTTPLVGYRAGVEGTGGPPDWDYESPGSLSGKAEVGVGDGPLTWGAILNENLICYAAASATAMTFVGGSYVMSFRRLFNKGCAGLYLAAEFNNQHFVLARDQIFIHDGSTVKLIAKDRVEEEFFRRAGKGGRFGGGDIDFSTMRLVKNPDRKEIVLFFTEPGGGLGLEAQGDAAADPAGSAGWIEVGNDPTNPLPDDPECQPYACDAIVAYLLSLEGDGVDVWEPTEATTEYTGATTWTHDFINAAGKRLKVSASTPLNLSFSDNTIISGACYTSWWRDGSGHSSEARTEDGKGSAGMLLINDKSSVISQCLSMTTNVLDPWGGSNGTLHVAAEDNNGNLHVSTSGFDGTENDHWVSWASVGVDPDIEPIVISMTTTYDVTYWIGDYDRKYMGVTVFYKVYVNGVEQVDDSHFYSTYWNKVDDGLGAENGAAVFGPHHSGSFFATGLYIGPVDMGDLQTAIARNYTDYESPDWCDVPVPAPTCNPVVIAAQPTLVGNP